jgi:hypothetical protein
MQETAQGVPYRNEMQLFMVLRLRKAGRPHGSVMATAM